MYGIFLVSCKYTTISATSKLIFGAYRNSKLIKVFKMASSSARVAVSTAAHRSSASVRIRLCSQCKKFCTKPVEVCEKKLRRKILKISMAKRDERVATEPGKPDPILCQWVVIINTIKRLKKESWERKMQKLKLHDLNCFDSSSTTEQNRTEVEELFSFAEPQENSSALEANAEGCVCLLESDVQHPKHFKTDAIAKSLMSGSSLNQTLSSFFSKFDPEIDADSLESCVGNMEVDRSFDGC